MVIDALRCARRHPTQTGSSRADLRRSVRHEGGKIAIAKQRAGSPMCRNIKTLFNFEPPATEEEIRASALQFVRKLSGFNAPSKANQAAFDQAVSEVTAAARMLVYSLVSNASPKLRDIEAGKALARRRLRFPQGVGPT
ncbi:MAG TPA: DUF2277 domain-containing protein [Xanthomonadales bacterium]|nr:DUF2277 domain-containing protein [Xanthomonadales bacterium]